MILWILIFLAKWLPWLPPHDKVFFPDAVKICSFQGVDTIVGIWKDDSDKDYGSFKFDNIVYRFAVTKTESVCAFAELGIDFPRLWHKSPGEEHE